MLETFWSDVRYGARMLAKNPAITAIAVVSIAFGIGVNAVMFSVADGLALRPLQVPHSGDVVAITVAAKNDRDAFFGSDTGMSYPDYVDLRDRSRSFTGLVAYSNVIASLADRAGEPPRGTLASPSPVTSSTSSSFGPRGRMFVPADDRVSATPVVVLPYDTWTERFGADPGTGTAHCLEAALTAAVVLEQHRYPPLVLSFESIDLLDHVIFVYRTPAGWGSVARSRDPGLHGRRPVFATPRALALSYFESYVDFTGCIKGYAVVDLRTLGRYDWRLADGNVWKVEQFLLDWPHRRIAWSRPRVAAMRERYRAFREAHGYKPWKYYAGRDRWTELPPEFRRRG